MVDALVSLLIVTICVTLTSVFVQTYHTVQETSISFIPWQKKEVPCEIWCKSVYGD